MLMFFLFCHDITELLRPIAVKQCHMIGIWVRFIMQVQKFGVLSQKNCWAKDVPNF